MQKDNKPMTKKTFTLIELVLSIILMSSVIMMVYCVYLFFAKQVPYNKERYDMLSQINYALEDMKVRCVSASQVDQNSLFSLAADSYSDIKYNFKFFGEKDIYNITPNDTGDNVWYEYRIEDKNLILETQGVPTTTKEVLVNGKYQPKVTFEWYTGYEPNFFTVTITAQGTTSSPVKISKTEGIRFWFVDVKQ